MSHYICCNASAIWILIWMVNNIGVTLLNKAAFAKVSFPYPWFLSVIHMICNYMGCQLLFLLLHCCNRSYTAIASDEDNDESDDDNTTKQKSPPSCLNNMLGGSVERKTLNWKGYGTMVAFSTIFSLNIAIGNVSLKYVTVNFNQVMRSAVPAVTILLGLCMGKTFTLQRKLAVLPIILGVAMACFGDMDYTIFGLFVTIFCVVLAALKAVLANEILTGDLKLHPVDLLCHMALLAMIQCFIISIITGEVTSIVENWNIHLNPATVGCMPMMIVLMSGFASFTLNICSLQTNKLTSPLTLCIAANVKQVLMILLSTVIFETIVSPLNGAGIVVVLCGSAIYSFISIQEKPDTSSSSPSKITKTPPDMETKQLVNYNKLDDTDDETADDTTDADSDDSDYNDVELSSPRKGQDSIV